jgi:hypothetical protein
MNQTKPTEAAMRAATRLMMVVNSTQASVLDFAAIIDEEMPEPSANPHEGFRYQCSGCGQFLNGSNPHDGVVRIEAHECVTPILAAVRGAIRYAHVEEIEARLTQIGLERLRAAMTAPETQESGPSDTHRGDK